MATKWEGFVRPTDVSNSHPTGVDIETWARKMSYFGLSRLGFLGAFRWFLEVFGQK